MKDRLPLLDSLRGFALLLMTIYHFCFDLDLAELVQISFYEGLWPYFRALILSLFLGIAGASLALGDFTYRSRAFRQRMLRLSGGALLITVATYLLFPTGWVSFGVLHFLLVATLLAPLYAKRELMSAALGPLLILLPLSFQSQPLPPNAWAITGLLRENAQAVDFVPLLPWLGVVMTGAWFGNLIKNRNCRLLQIGVPALSWLGRHSLVYYLAHQALLLPLAWLIARAVR